MDNTEESQAAPRILSFCTGYGGIEIGLRRVFGEITELAHVEIEAYAIANLVAKMEAGEMVPTPVWSDLKTFPAELFRGKVDILTGGYPCQPFSHAGHRKGTEDPRHLWPFIRDHIRTIEPLSCFFENVGGHLSMGYGEIYRDLRGLGYRVEAGLFTAEEVGAPHKRERLFILAMANTIGTRIGNFCGQAGRGDREKDVRQGNREKCTVRIEPASKLANAENHRCKRKEKADSKEREILRIETEIKSYFRPQFKRLSGGWPSRPGEEQYDWEEPRTVGNTKGNNQRRDKLWRKHWERIENRGHGWSVRISPQCKLGRTINGNTSRIDPITNRVDRLRMCGNGVVPQTAELAFRTLLETFLNNNRTE